MTNMGTNASPLLFSENVQFRRDGYQLCVEHAPPVLWFARHILVHSCAKPPDIGLSFDGINVTLHAANGRWVWRLTGRSRCHRYQPDAHAVIMLEGMWPD